MCSYLHFLLLHDVFLHRTNGPLLLHWTEHYTIGSAGGHSFKSTFTLPHSSPSFSPSFPSSLLSLLLTLFSSLPSTLSLATHKVVGRRCPLNDLPAELLQPVHFSAVGSDLILHLLMALEETLLRREGGRKMSSTEVDSQPFYSCGILYSSIRVHIQFNLGSLCIYILVPTGKF